MKGHLLELIRKLKLHCWISGFVLQKRTFQFQMASLNFILLAATQSYTTLPAEPGTLHYQGISFVGIALRVFYLALEKKCFRAAWTTKPQHLLGLPQVLKQQSLYKKALCQRKQDAQGFNPKDSKGSETNMMEITMKFLEHECQRYMWGTYSLHIVI